MGETWRTRAKDEWRTPLGRGALYTQAWENMEYPGSKLKKNLRSYARVAMQAGVGVSNSLPLADTVP